MTDGCDVLIIGAGVSGIGMACRLAQALPRWDVQIVERRATIGGTWDLFRYPGVRSDSDMFTYAYDFRPWQRCDAIADGGSIRAYVAETARAHAIDRKIRFGLKCRSAQWSSRDCRWTVQVEHEAGGAVQTLSCRFLINASGYFNHDHGFMPAFDGVDVYRGRLIHPQQWPEDLDYRGKRVVVIGSGATAVTIVPRMAASAAHVVMLQRSPSYLMALPGFDAISALLRRVLPDGFVFGLARARNIRLQLLIYKFARRFPGTFRALLLAHVKRSLAGSAGMAHFEPNYPPWDERLCAVQDGDLFKALRSGRASVVTDRVERFVEHGIRLASGRVLEADIVVAATGLELQALGGMSLAVDGQAVDVSQRLTYKAVLLEGVPNFGWLFGYVNASWTLKVDLATRWLCRLFAHLEANGLAAVTPRAPPGAAGEGSVLSDLRSGYVRRGSQVLPRQGRHGPWRVTHDYRQDRRMLADDQPLADDALEFVSAA